MTSVSANWKFALILAAALLPPAAKPKPPKKMLLTQRRLPLKRRAQSLPVKPTVLSVVTAFGELLLNHVFTVIPISGH